jgi:hypothetical protein
MARHLAALLDLALEGIGIAKVDALLAPWRENRSADGLATLSSPIQEIL